MQSCQLLIKTISHSKCQVKRDIYFIGIVIIYCKTDFITEKQTVVSLNNLPHWIIAIILKVGFKKTFNIREC